MIIRKVFYFFILFFCTLTIHAQTRCGHVEYMDFLYKNDPTLKHQHDILNKAINARLLKNKISKTTQTSAAELNYKIPVVVHVIHNVSSGEITGDNISDAQIFSQIDILNKDYQRTNLDTSDTYAPFKTLAADTKISFCLASIDPDGNSTNGIVRVYDQKSNFSIDEELRLKGISYWPAESYLNIWVCDVTAPILGYAQFPNNTSLPGLSDNMGSIETDGVVIDYRYFGDINTDLPYHMGRTATHEVGHWLGLIHLWGDTYCGDDYIDDTPSQDDANVGPGCNTEYSSCDGPTTVDMSQNYMDYSEDACMNLFTYDQKDRMRAVMQVSPKRASLLNSIGCCPYEDRKAIPYSVDFEDDSYLSEGWKIINYDESSIFSKKWEKYTIALTDVGTSSIRIENDSVYSPSQSTYYDVIESPYIDLNHAQMFLDFDLAYANGTFNLNTDSLEIQYSEGCNGNWISYKTFYGDDLVTTERRTDDFVPLDSEWERVSVDLVHLSGKRWVKFRIAVYSKGVNTLYIDDIKFYKEAEAFVIYSFPMPVDDELTLEVAYEGYKDVTIQAFDMFGKKVLSLVEKDTPSFIKMVDVSSWEPGLYIIKVNTDKDYMPRRIQVY